MNLGRIFKHLSYPDYFLNRYFSESILDKIEAAIKQSESLHSGEICFAIEASLSFRALWDDKTSREQAIDVFSQLRVWDTQDNNGVLIYLLLADRKVEIIADRNITKVVDQDKWNQICKQMEQLFAKEKYESGVIYGINEIGNLLINHFPVSSADKNELSNKPVIL